MRRPHHSPSRRLVETGVTVYGPENLREIETSEEHERIIEEVVDIHNHNHSHSRIFGPLEGRHPKKDLKELALPPGTDPHEPVLGLARAALGFTNGFVASVDTTTSMVSWRATEKATEQLGRLTHASGFGFIFVVERQEDRGNERIRQLRQGVTELAVPTLVILTQEPEQPPAVPIAPAEPSGDGPELPPAA